MHLMNHMPVFLEISRYAAVILAMGLDGAILGPLR